VLHRRWRMLVTVGVAGLAAALLAILVDYLVETEEGQIPVGIASGLGPLTTEGFPSVAGVGVVAAMLTAAAPWLSRRWRRAGWVLVVGLATTRFLASPVSFASVQAALIGWLCGAAVLVAMGAPSRRPTASAVMDSLAGVGLPLSRLERAGVDARGSTPYFAVGTDGAK